MKPGHVSTEHIAAIIRDTFFTSRKTAYEADRYGNVVILRTLSGQTLKITVEDVSK